MHWDQLVQISKPLAAWLGFLGCKINGVFGVASADTHTVDTGRQKDQRELASCYSCLGICMPWSSATMTFI